MFVFLIFTVLTLISEIKCKEDTFLNCPAVYEAKVKSVNVKFYLSPSNSNHNDILIRNNELRKLPFDPSLRTTVIVHGFLDTAGAQWIQDMKLKLHAWNKMNVILVDWSDVFFSYKIKTGIGATNLFNYNTAALSTADVATQLSTLLVDLAAAFNLTKWRYLHFIGHSLGAHVAGQAAEKLKPHVDRVTGLDPAKPGFEVAAAHLRLRSTNAKFVDVIHTNSDPEKATYGLYQPLGHLDFYPNGGNNQPNACRDARTFNLLKNKWNEFLKHFTCYFFGVDGTKLIENAFNSNFQMVCNHVKACDYFIQSLDGNHKFLAVPIIVHESGDTCVEMGINAERYNERGSYYIDTTKDTSACPLNL